MIAALGVFAAAGVLQAAAQQSFDMGAATEVVRGVLSEDTEAEIRSSTNLMAAYRNQVLAQELTQEAARRGLTERIDVLRTLEESRRSTLITALRNDVTKDVPSPTEDQIKAAYQKQTNRFTGLPAFKLDVVRIPAGDTVGVSAAKALATGNAVTVDQIATLKGTRLASQTNANWLTSGQVSPEIWKGLLEMKQDEVRTFADGTNVMAVAYQHPFIDSLFTRFEFQFPAFIGVRLDRHHFGSKLNLRPEVEMFSVGAQILKHLLATGEVGITLWHWKIREMRGFPG